MKRGMNIIRTGGFTLVELLTTMAVVAILLGLLIPALNQVTKTATKVKQTAQFHAIGTALESFYNDYHDYPPSRFNGVIPNAATASHNLAEALVGRDGLGFHPSSEFRGDGRTSAGLSLYMTDTNFTTDYPAQADIDANLAARKGPYLEIESANAVKLSNLGLTTPLLADSYVLVDMYKINKNSATGKQVGMPILYYKANKMKIGNDSTPANWGTNTYNINDSFCNGNGLIERYWANRPNLFSDDQAGNAVTFYNAIQNPNFPGPPARPYRSESFLLQSAGPDGLYGTVDDIFNFDQDN